MKCKPTMTGTERMMNEVEGIMTGIMRLVTAVLKMATEGLLSGIGRKRRRPISSRLLIIPGNNDMINKKIMNILDTDLNL